MEVRLGNKRLRLDPSMSIGKGGEADIFSSQGRAVKVFKQPNHPDYKGLPNEQAAAKVRIAEHQRKLPAFPCGLPSHVVAPEQLVYDSGGNKIVGYTMKQVKAAEVMLRYSERKFRQAGITNGQINLIFQDLFATVAGVHQAGVIIGDFNDLNVLVSANEAYLIDADSFQFKQFLCKLFTARFVDPLLCDARKTSPELIIPYNANSDWYAYCVMLLQSWLYVDPYGGIYRPKDKRKLIPHAARPLRRITIFHPEVIYPKPALRYDVLPDEMLHYFHSVFVKDYRGEFPIRELQQVRWTHCTVCQAEHARGICPYCSHQAPAAIKEVVTVRGKVTASRLFHSPGQILFASYQNQALRWLYHEGGFFKRENRLAVVSGKLEPGLQFAIHDTATVIGKEGLMLTFSSEKTVPDKQVVDVFGNLTVFGANQARRYWLSNGRLCADGKLGPEFPETIGSVLGGQTYFWIGEEMGFGFYRAGNLNVAFVFGAQRGGLNDSVTLSHPAGKLIDADCIFSEGRAWFFTSWQSGGKIINRCQVIRKDGTVEATVQADKGEKRWLDAIHGLTALGRMLFCPTDEGIIRAEIQNETIAETQLFPDTESFVSADSRLLVAKEGMYVVNDHDIYLLKIK
jgi:H/ACA ribonucleoprotein complex subunit 3